MNEDTNNDQNQDQIDVNQAEDQTATTDTSGSQENTDYQTEVTESKESTDNQVPKTIPYERFAETNSKVDTLSKEIEDLKRERIQSQNVDPQQAAMREQAKKAFQDLASELGYVSKDELRQVEQDRKLDTELSTLEKEYDGKKDPELKFNRQEVIDFAIKNGIASPRMAFQLMKNDAIVNAKIKEAVSKSKGIKTETSNGSGVSNTGVSNDELKSRMAKGDSDAKKLYLRRVARQAFGSE